MKKVEPKGWVEKPRNAQETIDYQLVQLTVLQGGNSGTSVAVGSLRLISARKEGKARS